MFVDVLATWFGDSTIERVYKVPADGHTARCAGRVGNLNHSVTQLCSHSAEFELTMTDGFLGYKTSLMLDFVVCALAIVVPAIIYSLYLVKVAKRYTAHRNVQLVLAAILLIAVGAFEIDMQLIQGGWKNVVAKRDVLLTAEQIGAVQKVLWIHLVFAVTSPILWAVTITLALKRMPKPPAPCPHSNLHKKLGWVSTIDLALTAITGVWFYYVAFVR